MSIKSLDLYSYFFCPYAQRSLIAISEAQVAGKLANFSTVDKQTNFHYHEIDLHQDKQKEVSFLAINPQNKVPVLKIDLGDGTTYKINESLVINEFIQEQFHHDLIPKGKTEFETSTKKAQSRIWISYFDSNVPSFFYKVLFDTPTIEKVQSEFLPQIQEKLSFLTQHGYRINNDKSGPFFFGSNFSLIDIALYPFISRIDIILRHKFQTNLFQASPLAKNHDEVQTDLLVWQHWLTEAKKRQSIKWSSYEPRFVPEATYSTVLKKLLTGEEVKHHHERSPDISHSELNTQWFDYEKFFLTGLDLLHDKLAKQKK